MIMDMFTEDQILTNRPFLETLCEDQTKCGRENMIIRLQKQQPSLNTTLDFLRNRLVNFTRKNLFRKVVSVLSP